MSYHRDEDGKIILSIPVDDATVAWLAEIADMHHTPPELIAAAVLRDIREDDEDAHMREQLAAPRFTVVGGTDTLN